MGNIIQEVEFGFCHLWTLGKRGKREPKGSNRSLRFYFNGYLERVSAVHTVVGWLPGQNWEAA